MRRVYTGRARSTGRAVVFTLIVRRAAAGAALVTAVTVTARTVTATRHVTTRGVWRTGSAAVVLLVVLVVLMVRGVLWVVRIVTARLRVRLRVMRAAVVPSVPLAV